VLAFAVLWLESTKGLLAMPPKVRRPKDAVGLKITFGEDLRRKLEEAARESHRSMTSEIVYRLEQSFEIEEVIMPEPLDPAHDAEIDKFVDDLTRRFWKNIRQRLDPDKVSDLTKQGKTLNEAFIELLVGREKASKKK
jgi:hypothetical protein